MIIQAEKEFGPLLYGKALARRHYAVACQLLADARQGDTIVLDFRGVESVTGSWFNTMLVLLYDLAKNEQNDWFPVLTNLGNEFVEELELVAEHNHQCYLVGYMDGDVPVSATVIGRLDVAQRATLKAVLDLGRTTGAELAQKLGDQNVKATAWNNRLKDLHEKRLLRREKQGREQVYQTVVKEINLYGRQLSQRSAGELQEGS
jgi:hypothetical protein